MGDLPSAADRIIALIKLAGTLLSSAHEHLWDPEEDEVPNDLQALVNELQSLGKALAGLRNYSTGKEFPPMLEKLNAQNGPLLECAAELKRLQSKFDSVGEDTKGLSRLSLLEKEQISPHILRIEKYREVFALALQLMNDQSKYLQAMVGYIQDRGIGGESNSSIHYARMRALREAARRKESLNWIYSRDFESRYLDLQQRRLKGTGEWLLKSPIFRSWIKGKPGFHLLWGHAKAGAGKTYTCSKIIDHIQVEMEIQNYAVAYFFFDHLERDKQQPKHVLSCLLKQLACQSRSFPDRVLNLRLRGDLGDLSEPSVTKLSRNLVEVAKSFDQVFLVLDGLDECDETKQRKYLLPLLHTLAKENISLFVTSQLQPKDIQRSLRAAAKIDLSAKDEDIKIYIERNIDNSPRIQRLLEQGRCRDKFVAELTACASGMFLLVYLSLRFLCQQPTVKHLFKKLDQLKRLEKGGDRLHLAYSQLIDNVHRQDQTCVALARRILTWLVKAQRTLTVDELREAISVETDRYESEDSDLLDKETMLDICAGLVAINQNSGAVRLIHHTARDHLLKSKALSSDADYQVAMTCITYVSFSAFSSIADKYWVKEPEDPYVSFSDRLKPYPFYEYATKYLSAHINACSLSSTTNAFLKFAKNPSQVAAYLQVFGDKMYSWGGEVPPFSPLQVSAFVGHLPAVCQLIGTDKDQEYYGRRMALHEAVKGNHLEVVRLLLEYGKIKARELMPWETPNISITDFNGKLPLHLAARRGHKYLVKFLLESGAGIDDSGGGRQTALHEAARGGHEEVVELLLEKGASRWLREASGQTALHVAAEEGHEKIVKQLLEHNDSMLAGTQEHGWESTLIHEKDRERPVSRHVDLGVGVSALDIRLQTPLHLAALGSQTEVARLLMERGADVSIEDTCCETPLHRAARGGDKGIVQLLLHNGADVSVKTGLNVTALIHAARRGYTDIVRILLDNGADTSTETSEGHTALSLALREGYGEVTQLLLDNGADIHTLDEADYLLLQAAEDGHYDTLKILLANGADISNQALYNAAKSGSKDIVQLLLERGADISFRDEDRQSLLHTAARYGQKDVVRLLLENGVDVLAQDGCGQTPLHKAVGNEEIVQLLLEFGADISVQDNRRQTALILAAGKGRKEVVQTLIANGSDVLGHDVDGNTPLHNAARYGHAEVVKSLLDHGAQIPVRNQSHQTALLLAAATGSGEVVQLLLNRGADIGDRDEERRTAFIIAAEKGRHEVIEAILQNGGDISEKNREGQTALFLAAQNDYYKVLQLLIKKGVDISEKNEDGQTAFFVAVEKGHHNCVSLLLKNGANISEKNADGQTAFFVAVGKGHIYCVDLLLENGANISEKNADGQTALFLASDSWDHNLYQLLVDKGADEFVRDRHGNTPYLEPLSPDNDPNDIYDDYHEW